MTNDLTAPLDRLVDLDAFPIHRPGTPEYDECVATARDGLRSVGCAVLRDFVQTDAVATINDEIIERKHTTHFSTQMINPYFHTTPDPAHPGHHPVNTFIERSSGFIPGDSWEAGCTTDTVFRSPALARFLADCLHVTELHCYADPLAGLTANILDPGQQFTWHFDTNEFAVTLLVQRAERGGAFQHRPAIRSADDEGFHAIQHVLDSGDAASDLDHVHTLDLRPGDLQIFRGRHSLHRVERVAIDSTSRHAAIFAYTERPGVIGRVDRTRQLFGRVLPAHLDAESERVRSDALLD